jgi:hypothetical protein
MADSNEVTTSSDATETVETEAPVVETKENKSSNKSKLKTRASFEDRMKKAAEISGKPAEEELPEAEDKATDSKPEDKTPAKPSKGKSEPFTGTLEEKVTAAQKALEEGDIHELVRVLGADKKLADVSNEKYRVVREKAKKNSEIEGKLKAENTRLVDLGKTLREEFGMPKSAKAAYKAGKYSAAALAMQQWFGDDFATITKNFAKEMAGLSPEDKARLEEKRKFEEERAAFEAEKAKNKKQSTHQEQQAAALKTIESKCAGHPVLKSKNATKEILAIMENAWDADLGGFRITFKQAADSLYEEKVEEAKSLGLNVDGTPLKSKGGAPKPAVSTPAPKPVEMDGKFRKRVPFEQRMEEARRLTERTRQRR